MPILLYLLSNSRSEHQDTRNLTQWTWSDHGKSRWPRVCKRCDGNTPSFALGLETLQQRILSRRFPRAPVSILIRFAYAIVGPAKLYPQQHSLPYIETVHHPSPQSSITPKTLLPDPYTCHLPQPLCTPSQPLKPTPTHGAHSPSLQPPQSRLLNHGPTTPSHPLRCTVPSFLAPTFIGNCLVQPINRP